MGLREAYETGVAQSETAGCGICEWLEGLDEEDTEYANRILWERRTPSRFKFGAHEAALLLKAGGFQLGHNVVQRHRQFSHGREL